VVTDKRVVVCVGWRPGNPVRERNWDVVRGYYERLGLTVVSSDSDPDKPFNLSQAINRAVAKADDSWQVAIVPDADTMLAKKAIAAAVAHALKHERLVAPVSHYFRQREDGSWPDEPWRDREGKTIGLNGVLVWHRAAWDFLSGEDERLTGWNLRDVVTIAAAETFKLFGTVDGAAMHLWHPRWTVEEADWWGPAKGWPRSPDGFLTSPLAKRYFDAHGNPAAMRALLAERDLTGPVRT
jgi:hypothetical protein